MAGDRSTNNVDLAANLTVAWLTNPNVRANTEDATSFLKSIHDTLSSFSEDAIEAPSPKRAAAKGTESHEPAVTVRKSLASKAHIISLIDGKPYSTLKRHIGRHGMTPDQYRERYGLKPDYPMVAPAYAEKRRALAKKIGLGRKPGVRKRRAKKA